MRATASRVEVVGYDEDLLHQAAELRASEFGGTLRANHDYLLWKYGRNPYLDPPVVQFALRGASVVGMRGSIGTCWEARGARYVVPQGADLVVREDSRGQGIAADLQRAGRAELAARGLAYTITLSANAKGAATAVAGGWRRVAALDCLEWRKSPPDTWRALATRGRRGVTRLGRRALSPSRSAPDPFTRLDAALADRLSPVRRASPARLAGIAQRGPSGARLRHVRDETYFAWRLSNPLARYRALAAPDAYAVLGWDGREDHVHLVDWGADEVSALHPVARLVLELVGAARVWSASLDDPLRSAVGRLGHVRPVLDPSATFLVRSTEADSCFELAGLVLDEPSSWELRPLDSDAF